MGETNAFGFVSRDHEGGAFRFAEGEHRRDGGRKFCVFGNRAEHENAVVHFGLHVPQQRREVAFT